MMEGTQSALLSWKNCRSYFWHLPKTITTRPGWEDIWSRQLNQDATPGWYPNYSDSCSFFYLWTKYMSSLDSTVCKFQKNQSSCWVCGQLPMSNTPSLPWWLSLLQGSSWMALTNFTLGERDSSTMQANATANITEWNPTTRPISDTCSEPGCKYSFTLDDDMLESSGFMEQFWAWPSFGWLGRCTIDFPWAQGHLQEVLETAPVNLPLMQACRH